MFTGEYHHALDSKGRVIVPSRLREGLGDRFVITRGLDHCLFVYPNQEWVRLEQKLKNVSFTKKEYRAFMRFFFSGALEVETDKQGRILIPQNLRDYAGIEKDVTFIGVSSRVEIWRKDAWNDYSDRAEEEYEELAEKLEELDL